MGDVPVEVAVGPGAEHGEGFWPDGMTVDDEGMLWVACGRADAVHRYRRDGTLDGVVEVPTSNPTSVAFGGDDGGNLPGVTGRPAPRYPGATDDAVPVPKGLS